MSKGNSVKLRTFKDWGVESVIGYKTEAKDGDEMVNFIWCKICAGNKDGLKKKTRPGFDCVLPFCLLRRMNKRDDFLHTVQETKWRYTVQIRK